VSFFEIVGGRNRASKAILLSLGELSTLDRPSGDVEPGESQDNRGECFFLPAEVRLAEPSRNPSGVDARSMVLQATDIVQLIGQTVALKRRGKDFVGLCPFHQEKTPSFHVDGGKQVFYCYGCKAGGTCFDFVMKRDRVEFKDALVTLAEQAGIELPKYGGSKEKSGEKQVLLEAHSAACSLFEKLLSDPRIGQPAREYLEKRGFNAESIKAFQIGYVPDGWDNLTRSPLMRKFPPGMLALGGLVKQRQGGEGVYDTFRNRLMFPIRDENARIIAFGGRVMPGSEDPAKYLNSPETPLFSKSRCVFGIDLARKRIVETRTVAVVEGYTDVVMAHQYGCSNVVSILGTAMTEQHLQILRRFADRIVLLFDADTAGDTAVDRAVELFLQQPVEIAIASMPEGVDPDEYIMANGSEAFDQLLANASDALSYKWRQLHARLGDTDDVTAHSRAVDQYLSVIAAARGQKAVDPLRWGAILLRLAKHTGLSAEELNKRFKTNVQKPKFSSTASPNIVQNREVESQGIVKRQGPLTAQDRAERWILGILLNQPRLWQKVQQDVRYEDFVDDVRRQLAERYWDHQRHEGEAVLNEFLGYLDQAELVELAIELSNEADALTDAGQALDDAIEHLKRSQKRLEERKLVADLRRAPDQPGEAAVDEIDVLRQLQERARKPDLKRV